MLQQIVGAQTTEGNVQLLEELLMIPPAISVVATTGLSPTLTATGPLAGVAIGMVVTGTDIPASPPTTVLALDDAAHTVTMSAPATGVNAGETVLFQSVPAPVTQTVHLYKAAFSPSPANVEADFLAQECTFSGYAPVALTWGPAGLDSGLNGVSFSDRAEFQNSTGVVGDSVGGAWISTAPVPGVSVADVSLRYYSFPMPIPMTLALQTLGAVVLMNTPDLRGSVIVDN
jgi:hypothetical protein